MTLRPGKSCRKTGTKGQPEGSAVTSRAGKPGVAKAGLVSAETTGQNNSSSTPYEASAANGEWELFLTSGSHYCFIQLHLSYKEHHGKSQRKRRFSIHLNFRALRGYFVPFVVQNNYL